MSSLKLKLAASDDEAGMLREKIHAQESDIATLVSSMAKVSDKLYALHANEMGDRDFFHASGSGTTAIEPALELGLDDEVDEDDMGKLAVTALEQSLTKGLHSLMRRTVESRRQGAAPGGHHHHHSQPGPGARGRGPAGWEGLLSEVEDPLNRIMTQLADGHGHEEERSAGHSRSMSMPDRKQPLSTLVLQLSGTRHEGVSRPSCVNVMAGHRRQEPSSSRVLGIEAEKNLEMIGRSCVSPCAALLSERMVLMGNFGAYT